MLGKLFPDPRRCRLLFTDTDSLCYAIETDDVYEDLKRQAEAFDLSNLPPEHPAHSNVNKMRVGKLKDENAGARMLEFVGLRAKAYSFKKLVDRRTSEVLRLKGISLRSANITHSNYKQCLHDHCIFMASQSAIRSDHHRLETVERIKKALSYFDDKRYILEDGVTTLPYGHYSIVEDRL